MAVCSLGEGERKTMEILCYTRKPKEDAVYGKRMANSMHLAYRDQDGKFRPFHHNEGILYAKAVEDPQSGVLSAKSMKSPWLFAMYDGYGVAAVRTGAEGEKDGDSEGCVLFFTSRDLVHYEEKGLLRLQELGGGGGALCLRCRKAALLHLLESGTGRLDGRIL